MKTKYALLKTFTFALLFTATSWGQTTLVTWNFNGASNITIPGGELSPLPSQGAGAAQLVGGTTALFASGNATAGTMETETTSPPNYGWNTTGYPATGTGNKTAGVQFNVSTVNYAGIIFHFEQRLSNTAANTYVVQYTTNSTATAPVWIDAQTFAVIPAATGTGDTWYNSRTVDVSAIAALDNNPNVAFRILSAFDSGTGNYLAARSTSTYAGGTVRFDMVYISANTTLSVSQFNAAARFTISPNPSRNEVVSFSEEQDVRVFDMLGKLILVKDDALSIDTAAFTSGVYFIKTATGITKKLVVE